MTWKYYTNKAIKKRIDNLLFEAAKVFANCGKSYAERQEALKKEQEIQRES